MTGWAGRGAIALLLATILSGCLIERPSPLAELRSPAELPQPETTYLALGHQLLNRNEDALAMRAYVRSMRIEGVTAANLSGAGVAAERQGMLARALAFFEMALERAPKSVVANNNLGVVLFSMGEFPEARRAFQTAFVLSGGRSTSARRNLSVTEDVIAREDADLIAVAENPHKLQRMGDGLFILDAGDKTEQDG